MATKINAHYEANTRKTILLLTKQQQQQKNKSSREKNGNEKGCGAREKIEAAEKDTINTMCLCVL